MIRTLFPLLLLGCPRTQGTVVDPPAELQAHYDLPDSVGYPEGLAYHGPTRAFYVGSLEHGALQRIDVDGSVTKVFEPEAGWTSLGLKLHPDTQDVLVCAVQFPSTEAAVSELWVHTPDTGTTRRIPLLGAPSNCNDLVALGDDVYLTDREAARVHRVDLATDTASIWFEHPELEPQIIGNNGLVFNQNEDALLLGQFAPARLLHIPLADPDAITEVTLQGDSLGFLPNGADGLAWVENRLILAAHGSIARLETRDGWVTATVHAAATPAAIVAVTEAEGRLYGLNGEVIAFVLGTPADLPFELLELSIP